ncbi:hypothetical protein OE88DRAFT_1733696 [Heliocybe sulcata]|uniref:P-loop containing nucleoside triphosphate hydrolase protein n=1 Tax=Heliocybe sulcata TaxID=5364 RepID=A0A5C3N7P5_9AGAM|nr:hypothetical protein OE88DRAFT_1733696 [Heliocybe sulcata]
MRPTQAPVQVICLGHGRTGTSSLGEALEILGFGPFYHMFKILHNKQAEDYDVWSDFGEGKGKSEDLDRLFSSYKSVLDYPASMYPKELFEAYPDAKFILTVRDKQKWMTSMKATLIQAHTLLAASDLSKLPPALSATHEWWKEYGPLGTKRGSPDLSTSFTRHNDYVRQLIPAEQLLVYEVGEGWERLASFLQVPIPDVPFPRVNDTDDFRRNVLAGIDPSERKQY